MEQETQDLLMEFATKAGHGKALEQIFEISSNQLREHIKRSREAKYESEHMKGYLEGLEFAALIFGVDLG